jgi:ribosomal protein S17E
MQLWKSQSQKLDKKIGGYLVHKVRRPKSTQDSSTETVGV